MVSAVD